MTGVTLGFLIGVLSGGTFLFILKRAFRNGLNPPSTLRLTSQILALATFWFGGPWVATAVLAGVDWGQIRDPYLASLAVTFLVICGYPMFRLVVLVGNTLGGG